MSIISIINDAEGKIAKELAEMPRVNARELGLHPQSGRVWVDTTYGLIIAPVATRPVLDHFAGFQYVGEDYITICGNFIIYDGGDERIAEAIEYYEEHK